MICPVTFRPCIDDLCITECLRSPGDGPLYPCQACGEPRESGCDFCEACDPDGDSFDDHFAPGGDSS